MKRFFAIVIALCSVFLTGFPTVFADTNTPSGVIFMQPTGSNVFDNYFVIKGSSGKNTTLSLKLSNQSSEYPATELLYVSDALAANGGGMAAPDPNEVTTRGVGSWFPAQDRKQTITLQPSQSTFFKLTLTIPQNVTPGDHLGQIVLYQFVAGKQQKANNLKDSSITVNHAYEQSVAVLVNVPGPVHHHVTLNGITPAWSGDHLFFDLKMTDDGNVIEKNTTGTLKFLQNGKVLYTQAAKMGSLYPGTSTMYSFEAPDVLKQAGNYTVNVTWHYQGGKVENSFPYTIKEADVSHAQKVKLATQGKNVTNQSIILSPAELIWSGVGVLVLILVIALIIFWFVRRALKNKH